MGARVTLRLECDQCHATAMLKADGWTAHKDDWLGFDWGNMIAPMTRPMAFCSVACAQRWLTDNGEPRTTYRVLTDNRYQGR